MREAERGWVAKDAREPSANAVCRIISRMNALEQARAGMRDSARCATRRGRFSGTRWRSAASSGLSAASSHYERGILQVGDDLYDLGTFSRIFVVSLGKAAHAQRGGAAARAWAREWSSTELSRAPTRRRRTGFRLPLLSRAGIRCRTRNRCVPPRPFCARWIR